MASVLKSLGCFALRTNHEGKYLQSVYRKGGSRIEATADAVAGNARTRFFVEASKEEDGFVHVRSCYNNKYWVPVLVQDRGSSHWVIGTADEADEVESSDSCTLFMPVKHAGSMRFRHLCVQEYVCVSSIDDTTRPYLQLANDQENTSNGFTVLGLSQQKELPKYIAFKQYDENPIYLGMKPLKEVMRNDREEWTEWAIAAGGLFTAYGIGRTLDYVTAGELQSLVYHTRDKGHAGVICTVFTNNDGTVRIKSNNGGFWVRDGKDDIIPYGKTNGSASDVADSLFKVIHGDGFIALRNLGNNKIVHIRKNKYGFEYLKAEEDTLSQYTKLQFEEAILSREIYDVKYHLDEARIYDTKIVSWVGNSRTNDTRSYVKGTFSFTQKTEKVFSKKHSISDTSGFESSITMGTGEKSPIMASGQVTLSKETTSSQEKDESKSTTQEATVGEEYDLPPGKTFAGQLVATRSSSDVPYSYKQKILLTSGEEIISSHDDGIYTVSNNYGFNITITDQEEEIKRIMAGK